LTGAKNPWEADSQTIPKLQILLKKIEVDLRSRYPGQEITCVVSGQGMYWLSQTSLERFLRLMETEVSRLKFEGPLPIWNCSSTELFDFHADNLKRLILAVAHDAALLEHLKPQLDGQHEYLEREFKIGELSLQSILPGIIQQASLFNNVQSDDINFYERCRITRELIDRGLTSEEELGYSLERLGRAEAALKKNCEKMYPLFQQRVAATFNQMKEGLRQSESAQLNRACRWDRLFESAGGLPDGFQGYAKLTAKEREGLISFVDSRESELGQSPQGQEALSIAQGAPVGISREAAAPPDAIPAAEGNALSDQEIMELLSGKPSAASEAISSETTPSPTQKTKEDLKRMAFTTRRR